MPPGVMPSRDALQRLLDALQTFILEHLALARVEMKQDLREMGRDLATGAAGLPALAVGYLLLMIAISWLLAIWLPNWAAFGIVAFVNLAAGGLVSYRGTRRVMADRIALPRTAAEIRRDREWLASLKERTPADAAVERGDSRPSATPASRPEGTAH
jgi:uncharacterized membrane protein YqjE